MVGHLSRKQHPDCAAELITLWKEQTHSQIAHFQSVAQTERGLQRNRYGVLTLHTSTGKKDRTDDPPPDRGPYGWGRGYRGSSVSENTEKENTDEANA